MSDWVLTGKRRYRVLHRFGRDDLLVLQVQMRGIETTYVAGSIDSDTVSRWRDARVADITMNDLPVSLTK